MLWLTLAGCLIDRETYETRKAFLADDDGDGYSDYQGDCDDANDAVFPGAGEACNFDDDDCDGAVDEGEDLVDSAWYADADEDGFGGGSPLATCEPPDGFVDQGGDCDDTALGVFPARRRPATAWTTTVTTSSTKRTRSSPSPGTRTTTGTASARRAHSTSARTPAARRSWMGTVTTRMPTSTPTARRPATAWMTIVTA